MRGKDIVQLSRELENKLQIEADTDSPVHRWFILDEFSGVHTVFIEDTTTAEFNFEGQTKLNIFAVKNKSDLSLSFSKGEGIQLRTRSLKAVSIARFGELATTEIGELEVEDTSIESQKIKSELLTGFHKLYYINDRGLYVPRERMLSTHSRAKRSEQRTFRDLVNWTLALAEVQPVEAQI